MMKTYKRYLVMTVLAGTASVLHPNRVAAEALPIPTGFDFPAPQAELEKMRDNQDIAAMRKHAWMLFAGLTQLAPGGEPIWETWLASRDVMKPGARPQGSGPRLRDFRQPRQFRGARGAVVPQSPGASLAEFVLFNEKTRKHIVDEKLNAQKTLTDLNGKWTPATPIKDRKIKDFPPEAMSLKTAWFLVSKSGLTGMPVWDEQPRQATYPERPPGTWGRAVAVDPARETIPADETADVPFEGKQYTNAKVVPLSAFYAFKLSQAMVDALKRATIFGDRPKAGDYLALVNFHFTTKEIPDWVWGTAWWHDQPDQAPYGEGRPDAMKGVWRNYKMDVAFSMDTPKESDNTAKVVFNPWLEARFPNGANSNCMTCHQRAVWPDQGFLPVTRGAAPADDPLFQQSTKADFLWSVIFESQ